ncbi:MAG: hypothetical protein KC620_04410 [Myxococcales bacterium]|nr:hypothetical protein [Myxococcales bacterium]
MAVSDDMWKKVGEHLPGAEKALRFAVEHDAAHAAGAEQVAAGPDGFGQALLDALNVAFVEGDATVRVSAGSGIIKVLDRMDLHGLSLEFPKSLIAALGELQYGAETPEVEKKAWGAMRRVRKLQLDL